MNKTKFTKLINELNRIAEEELSPKSPKSSKYICSEGRHWSDLPNTKIGTKCICNGIWQLNK